MPLRNCYRKAINAETQRSRRGAEEEMARKGVRQLFSGAVGDGDSEWGLGFFAGFGVVALVDFGGVVVAP